MKKTTADRLRAARNVRGYSQAELARRANVSRDIIAKIETGWTKGKAEVMEKIAKALGISPALLQYGEEQAELNDDVWEVAKRLQSMTEEQREPWLKAIKAASESKD